MTPEDADKCRAIFRVMCWTAIGYVRVTNSGGGQMHSECFPLDRGVVQGDIFSPICFIIALTVILSRYGSCVEGSAVGFLGLFIKSLECADDAALLGLTIGAATERINRPTSIAVNLRNS